MSKFQNIFDKNRYDIEITKKSSSWFVQQSQLLANKGITHKRILNDQSNNFKSTIIPGNMYMFQYDPKNKDTLPYYDKFPLVFPFRVVQGGFLGLNMHYLPYFLRIKLLDRLLVFKNTKELDEKTKLKFSWEMIGGVAKFAPAMPCVKHYLNDHVKSRFVKVDATDWATALMLPVENFAGSTRKQVWKESLKVI